MDNNGLIMILNEDEIQRMALEKLLNIRGFKTIFFDDAEKIPDTLYWNPPDVIIIEVRGRVSEICRKLRSMCDIAKIPIVAVSESGEYDDRAECASLGVFDYISGPYLESELFARIDNHMKNILSIRWLRERMSAQISELTEVQMETIIAIAELAESRDSLTANHLKRVRIYCKLIAEELSKNKKFAREITSDFIDLISHASALHDIGKIGVRDGILNKYGRLTDEEFEIVASHTTRGSLTLESVLEKHPNNPFVKMGADIVRFHHERWDGEGYPFKIAGEAIPLSARIMAIADVYDAVRSKRSYKESKTHHEAVDEILRIKGKQLGPNVVDAFIAINPELAKVYEQFPE